jgi:hypothetical protein
MALRFIIPVAFLFLMACGDGTEQATKDSLIADSIMRASMAQLDSIAVAAGDTEFHTALPPVFDGDIILQVYGADQPKLWGELMPGKYNHCGLIIKRPKDGILCVVEVVDSVRLTELTNYVDRAEGGKLCVMRIKNANLTLNEEKVKALLTSAKTFKGIPFDPVLNWDDSHMYPAELIWKIYNNAMMLTLCEKTVVDSFHISADRKAELNKQYGGTVSGRDEAVSIEDIYNSPKLEIVYEK